MTFEISKWIGDGQRLASLGPGQVEESKRALLLSFNPQVELGRISNLAAAQACHAGLWLYHDFHDEAHDIAQALHTPEGSAWHAIIHRREPDSWNSNYWWSRVGDQPWIRELKNTNVGYHSPKQFVELCDRLRGSGTAEEEKAKAIQLAEWHALFGYCLKLATMT